MLLCIDHYISMNPKTLENKTIMKTLAALLTGALFCSTLSAQDVVVRQNNGASHFHYVTQYNWNELQDIVDVASPGDTIYLPGATFTINGVLTIDKKLVLMGTGWHPDSAGTAGVTKFIHGDNINHAVRLMANADDSEFHGIDFELPVRLGEFDQGAPSTDVDGLRFSRCHLRELHMSSAAFGLVSMANDCLIVGCVVDFVEVRNAPGMIISNSILVGEGALVGAGSLTLVEHCILLNTGVHSALLGVDALFRYNIFTRPVVSTTYTVAAPCRFESNVWLLGSGSSLAFDPDVPSHVANGTVTVPSALFTSVVDPYNYTHQTSYQVVPGSPWAAVANGGPVGIYGGPFPWKDGMLPFNPHWVGLAAPGGATSNGVLQGVQIRGTAQSH